MILLITGATSDIASQFIRTAHSRYDKIIAFYHNSTDRINELKAICGNKLTAFSADFNDSDSYNNVLCTLKSLPAPDHVLHFAANPLRYDRFTKFDTDDFTKAIDCSVISLQKILKAVMPEIAKRKSGKIVILLSSCTENIPPSFMSPYVVSKYALLGLMKALSVEYAEKGICVNALSPVMVDTRFLADVPELIVEAAAEKNSIGRNLRVGEVIPAIEFLLSEASDRINGQNIQIG
jgi:3-oxoacyl-[acyl-carrier protein] reductase